jgi:hypothetical protein
MGIGVRDREILGVARERKPRSKSPATEWDALESVGRW